MERPFLVVAPSQTHSEQHTLCVQLTFLGLLVASHIVPWRADATNRLNPRNGLCLSMIHDKAFDIGIICVADDFTVRVSQKYKKVEDVFFRSTLLEYDGKPIRLPEKFWPNPEFLAYHREHVFIDSK